MRRLLPLLLISIQVYGQKKNVGPPADYDLQCVYKKKYPDSARMKFYPFNKAAEVKLVSFRYQSYDTIPVSRNSVKSDSLVEVKLLSKAGLNTLTDILYHNFIKKRGNVMELSQCWFPRNAILFYDSAGKLFETVIICFHCKEYQTSSEKVNLGEKCNAKVEKLRMFFISQGVKFGTDPEVSEYPGETVRDRSPIIPPLKN
jgi:hypothetical protein